MKYAQGSGRRWFLIGVLLVPAALWLAFPLWIDPIARLALGRADARLLELDVARPGLAGIDVPLLHLEIEGGRVRLAEARLDWRLDGRLTRLRVGDLRARIEAGPPAPADPAPVALPDPAGLLAALPVERLEIDAADLSLPAADLRFTGRLAAGREAGRIDGVLVTSTLPVALDLHAAFDGADRFDLRVGEGAGPALLDAELRITTTTDSVGVEGVVEVRPALLPSLRPGTPSLAGTARLTARIAPGDARLTLLPGTRLVVAAAAPAFEALIEPTEAWRLGLREGRIESSGHLDLPWTGTLPRGDGAPEIELDGHVRMTSVTGTPTAPGVEMTGHFAMASGELSARGAITLDARLAPDAHFVLAPETSLREVDLEDAAAQQRLEGLTLRLATPLDLDLRDLSWADTELSGSAMALALPRARIDLSALRLGAQLAGSIDAPRLRLRADGGGIGLRARARVVAGAAEAELDRLRIEFGSGLPKALQRSFAPPGHAFGAGTLELEALRWPPRPGGSARAVLRGLTLTVPGIELEGLDAGLELFPDDDETTFVLAGGALRRAQASGLRVEDLQFSAEGSLGAWTTSAARTGALPEALVVDAVALSATRISLDGRWVEAPRVSGAARLDARGATAALEVSAPALSLSVPAADLACGVDLRPRTVGLRDCGLDLLGGQIEIPAATIDLPALSGYLPVALRGLDLGAVLLLMQDEALRGDGVLDGALPLRLLEGGVPTIRDGYLGARPPGGRLRYDADAALLERMDQPGLSLAMAALGDFRYRELGAQVDYERDGTLGLRVRLAGASPRVENGRAIAFNLDVTQNLPLLLQSLRLSQTISEAIERRLQERSAPR